MRRTSCYHPTGASCCPISALAYSQHGILASSPSNAFHSTTSAAFQPQPPYDQMAAAAVNEQDYYQHQHQPMIYMPPVSHYHNPPPSRLRWIMFTLSRGGVKCITPITKRQPRERGQPSTYNTCLEQHQTG